MALVEDIDRGEPPGFQDECDEAFQLEVGARRRRLRLGCLPWLPARCANCFRCVVFAVALRLLWCRMPCPFSHYLHLLITCPSMIRCPRPQLRPYQRRALAHMLREERAGPTASNPGGSARHMWVKLPLPENPDAHCFVSPILHQIRWDTGRA